MTGMNRLRNIAVFVIAFLFLLPAVQAASVGMLNRALTAYFLIPDVNTDEPVALRGRAVIGETNSAYAPPDPGPSARLTKGIFLVAILLVDYSSAAAMGIVINKPTNVPVISALPHLADRISNKQMVRLGGPVALDSMSVLVRTDEALEQSRLLFENVYFINEIEALSKVLATPGPEPR